MPRSILKSHARTERRRWRVPPPILRGPEPLEGMGVLEEVEGEVGGLLWRSLRTVTLWAAVPPADRSGLFAQGAEEQRLADLLAVSPGPALEEPLTMLAGLLGRPDTVRGDLVALACTRIAQWANARGAHATELEFAQAAAAACPGDPRLALAVGRAARDRAEYPRAETWLHRTIALARQVGDWDSYARAYIALGKMFVARGAFPNARKNLQKALRAAERRGLREPQGMAAHDLFTVEAECSNPAEAQEYAARALRAYGAGHSLLPALAHDVAYFWLERGNFAHALPVLRATVQNAPVIQRARGHGNIARAAGAIGDLEVFNDSWAAVWSTPDEAPYVADALVEAAQGAASLGLWKHAEQAAHRALGIARVRGLAKLTFTAEAVLESVRNDSAAHMQAVSVISAHVTESDAKSTAEVLVDDLVRCLAVSGAST